ncbi:MAG TPA: DUF2231 domain-containing protein [bacterium]|nr:DUF2231 domain-containing protein [bacterium]
MGIRINWPVELHPMLVHFSVALLCFAFFLDLAAWLWRSQPSSIAALYSLAGGAVATVLSVLSGLITPEAREREDHELSGLLQQHTFSLQRFFTGRLVEVHKHWAYLLLGLVIVWVLVRVGARGRRAGQGLALAAGALAMIVLVVTGYYGGDLVYGRRGRERGHVVPAVQSIRGTHTPISAVP